MTVWAVRWSSSFVRLAIDFPCPEELGRGLAVVGERERRVGREQAVLIVEDRQVAEPDGFAVGQFDAGRRPNRPGPSRCRRRRRRLPGRIRVAPCRSTSIGLAGVSTLKTSERKTLRPPTLTENTTVPCPPAGLLVVVESDLAGELLAGAGQLDDDLAGGVGGDAAGELLVDDFQRLVVAGVLFDRAVVHGDDQARLLAASACGAANFAATKRRASAISSAVGLVAAAGEVAQIVETQDRWQVLIAFA